MTIQEFDAKRDIRNTIDEIDQILTDLEYWPANKNALKDNFEFQGIGTVALLGCSKIANGVNDPVIIKEFKELLLRRKQELIDEFMK